MGRPRIRKERTTLVISIDKNIKAYWKAHCARHNVSMVDRLEHLLIKDIEGINR